MTRGYLISDGFRDRIERTIERVAGTPYGGGVTNVTPRLESISSPGRGSPLRLGVFAGGWRKDFPNNLKTVTLLRATADGNPPWVPELDSSGNMVQVVAFNVLAHIAAPDPQYTRYCLVQEFGEVAFPSPYGKKKYWVLVSGEC